MGSGMLGFAILTASVAMTARSRGADDADRARPEGNPPLAGLPDSSYSDKLIVNGRPIGLYTLPNDGSRPGRRAFGYHAPVRVSSWNFNDKTGKLTAHLDLTIPDAVVKQAQARIAADMGRLPGQVEIVPLRPIAYEAWLGGFQGEDKLAPVKSRTLTRGEIGLPNDLPISWYIPESLAALRREVTEGPADLTLNVALTYNFSMVARGTVSNEQSEYVVHAVFERLRPTDPSRPAQAMLVDRDALNVLKSNFSRAQVGSVRIEGLTPDRRDALVSRLSDQANKFLGGLPSTTLWDVLNASDHRAVYYTKGPFENEIRVVTVDDTKNEESRKESFTKDISHTWAVLSDVFSKEVDDRKAYEMIHEKMSVDASLSVGYGIFNLDADFGYETDKQKIVDNAVKKLAEMRKVHKDEGQRRDFETRSLDTFVKGEMKRSETRAKEIRLYRIDERDLTQNFGSSWSEEEVKQIVSGVKVTPVPLLVEPPDHLALLDSWMREQADAVASLQDQAGLFRGAIDKLGAENRAIRKGLKVVGDKADMAATKEDVRSLQATIDGLVSRITALEGLVSRVTALEGEQTR